MFVDFRIKTAPKYRVATITRVGPWKEDNLKAEFQELRNWTKAQGLRTGKWIFLERSSHRWEACLEIRGRARAGGRIRLKVLPPADAVSVVFDPDRISSRVVYHGLRDWTRWRRKDGTIKKVTAIREIYRGDPWSDRTAWANCEVQFLIQR